MITIEKLKIYRHYKGDGDSFARSGRNSEKELINDNDWSIITSSEQNIELIAKGLSSSEFRNTAIQIIKNNFDPKAFAEITKPILTFIT